MSVGAPWGLPPDVAASAAASALLLLFSLASAVCVLYLRLRASRSLRRRRRRVLLGLSSLWPARLLLSLFAALWAATELLPILLALPTSFFTPWAPPSPNLVCQARALASDSICEPCFFATLLFLLRASTSSPHLADRNHSSSAAALSSALASALPFLVLHSLYPALAPWLLPKLRLPPDLLGTHIAQALGERQPNRPRCAYPLFGTALLAALAAVYVPLFVSACWAAVALVINKRLCIRLYALAASVVAALLLQVTALALSALWAPWEAVSRALALVGSIAVLASAAAGVGILVIRPALDALAMCDPQPSGDIEDDRHGGPHGGASPASELQTSLPRPPRSGSVCVVLKSDRSGSNSITNF